MVIRFATLLFAGAFPPLRAPALDLWSAKSEIRSIEPSTNLKLTGIRTGDLYRSRLTNSGKTPVHVNEVALFRIAHDLPRRHGALRRELSDAVADRRHARHAGESRLRRTGALQDPAAAPDATRGHRHADADACRGPDHAARLHQLPALQWPLLPASEIHRGGARYRRPRARARRDRGISKSSCTPADPNRAALLSKLAGRIDRNHPPLQFKAPPAGWCSWYCFGPRVTAKNVMDNLAAIVEGRAAAEVRPARRRLPAGHGRLAGDRPGLRRRRAGRAAGDPQAGLRAGHLGGARSSPRPARTSSSSIPTGS